MKYKTPIFIAATIAIATFFGMQNKTETKKEWADVTVQFFFQDSVVKIVTEKKDWEKNIPCNMVNPMRDHIYYITEECDSSNIKSLKLKK